MFGSPKEGTGRPGGVWRFIMHGPDGAEHGGKTVLSMQALFETDAERDRVAKEFGAIEGGNQTLDRLAAYLAND
jgi:uncharacterized protein YndB with AHSA1/START domain